MEFADWINREASQRGWSLRQIARRGEISQTPIIRVANGTQLPTFDVCVALARAFGLTPESVLRMAKLLPSAVAERRIVYEANGIDRLVELWRGLSVEDQGRMLDLLERLQAPVEPRIVGEEAATDESG